MARIDGLEQVLVTYPVNVAGGYTVVPGDGTTHFGLVLNAARPAGLHQGVRRHAAARADRHKPRPANTDARCTEPRGSPSSVRGAQNAPADRPRPSEGTP